MRVRGLSADQRASYSFLIRWICVAVVAGVAGSLILAGFRWLVDAGQLLLLESAVPVPLFALAAALVTGLIVYRVSPDAAGEGVPSYISALVRQRARFSVGATLMKLPAALLALTAFGSGGMVGPVGRAVSGLMALLMGRGSDEVLREEHARTAAICGMAATVGALFHAPVGGGIFAVEVIQRTNMRYRDLFPGLLAGSVAVWFSRAVGFEPLITVLPDSVALAPATIPWTALFAVVVGLLSGLFAKGYAVTVRVFRRDQGHVPLKVAIGMVAASTIVWLVNPQLLGTASPLTNDLANGGSTLIHGSLSPAVPLALAAIVMLLLRVLGSYLTTGSGMSAGLTAPAVQIGMLAAVAAAQVVAPVATVPLAAAFIVVGFVGMLAGAMNVPLAAAVLGIEVFGSSFAIPAAIAAVIAFQMNRHATIYDFALAGSGRDDEAPLRTN